MTVIFVVLVLLILPLLAGASYFGLSVFKIALILDIVLLVYAVIEIIYLKIRLEIGKIKKYDEVLRGEQAPFSLTLKLKTYFLPADVSISVWYGLNDHSMEPEHHVIRHSLIPGKLENIVVSLMARHVGSLELDEINIVIRGISGILKTKISISPESEDIKTLVLPLADFDANSAATAVRESKEGDIERHSIEDRSDEIDTLREYDPGDDIRRMHWQVSARLQSMMIKRYEEPLELRSCVMLDEYTAYETLDSSSACEEALNLRDILLDSATGILREFLTNSLFVRLETGSGKQFANYSKKAEHLQSFRRQLASLPPDSTPELGAMIVRELQEVSADRYLLISSRLSLETIRAIMQLREKVSHVSLFYFTTKPIEPAKSEAFERMRMAGIDVLEYFIDNNKLQY